MGDNGKIIVSDQDKKEENQPVDVIRVMANGDNLSISFGKGVKFALLSHAIRLIEIQLDTMILKSSAPRVQQVNLPKSVFDKLRRR